MTKPNVLLFFTDDQRFDTIGAWGNKSIKTPHMDALAADGTSFRQAHIPSGTSGAVCMPSRAMLHTGRSLFHLTNGGSTISQDHKMMGELLGEQGYDTFACGKWHNGSETFNRGFKDGDNIFFGGMADHWNVPCFTYDSDGKYDKRIPYCINASKSKEVRYTQADYIKHGEHSSEILSDCTVEWLANRKLGNPFFAYVSFLAPHDPRVMPEEFQDMYDPREIELPPNYMGGHPFENGALHIRDEELAAFPREQNEIREHIADYYAMITHLDHCLGRVIQQLKDNGEYENTIIIFAGDNGLALGQHGLMGKQSHYEHSIRVPLIVSGPGVQKGQETDTPVYLFDIFPTLCDFLNMDIPRSVDGISFSHELFGETKNTRETMFFAYTDCQRSIKKNNWKYIEYVIDGQNSMTQLFDLESDPWELSNLACDPNQLSRCKEMLSDLRFQAEKWDDTESKWGKVFWAGLQENKYD
ncbi:MAG: sulfatase-like hydrolase/transferase [Lentisphaeria bacterium]|nr:sulfatase-like hydrolase/transferase [Lentisphaeria bacterium]